MEDIPQEVMIRLDKLAETIGTSVGSLFNALHGDAIRFGQAQILYGIGLFILAISIVTLGNFLIKKLFLDDLPKERTSNSFTSPYQDWRNGLGIPVLILFVIFTGIAISSIYDGIETLSQPTQYALRSLGGLLK